MRTSESSANNLPKLVPTTIALDWRIRRVVVPDDERVRGRI
jgi:hypothetical protein